MKLYRFDNFKRYNERLPNKPPIELEIISRFDPPLIPLRHFKNSHPPNPVRLYFTEKNND